MSEFVETLKARVAVAQQRLTETKQRLEVAQSDYQKAIAEFTAWQGALLSESRNELQKRLTAPTVADAAVVGDGPQANVPAMTAEVNKTDLIRDALRRRPTGLTPDEVWRLVQDQIANRSYVYAVLGRLKEKDEVYSRRGKYYIRIAEKAGAEEAVVQ